MWTEKILSRLEQPISREMLHCFTTLPSTNDTAKEMASAGAPDGTVVVADNQTKGRGRMGRSFHSPAGSGIYLSRILLPNCPPGQLMHLTCAVAVAVCDAVQKICGYRPGIKWVNDLVAEGRKLGGILTEMSLTADGKVRYCVVGIGLNCARTPMPPELKDIAISLEEVTGKQVDRAAVIAAILDSLAAMELESSNWMDAYRKDCITLGKQIRVLAQEPYSATAVDVDPSGALTVALPDGTLRRLDAGEVSIRGMYDYAE